MNIPKSEVRKAALYAVNIFENKRRLAEISLTDLILEAYCTGLNAGMLRAIKIMKKMKKNIKKEKGEKK